jgi:preprotein translocase subunit SecE
MMSGSTLIVIAMVAMMALMCGGMLLGGGRLLQRWRKRDHGG